jgi:hypothetical protein
MVYATCCDRRHANYDGIDKQPSADADVKKKLEEDEGILGKLPRNGIRDVS